MSNNEEFLEAIKDYLAMKDEEVLAANNRALKFVRNNLVVFIVISAFFLISSFSFSYSNNF